MGILFKGVWWFGVIVVLGVIGWYIWPQASEKLGELPQLLPETTEYRCSDGKGILVVFSTERASLQLSDGRTFDLKRSPAGADTKYASAGDEQIFWIKDYSAFFEEDGMSTYTGCVVYPLTFPQ